MDAKKATFYAEHLIATGDYGNEAHGLSEVRAYKFFHIRKISGADKEQVFNKAIDLLKGRALKNGETLRKYTIRAEVDGAEFTVDTIYATDSYNFKNSVQNYEDKSLENIKNLEK